jgi:hypothetical protein
MCGEFYKNAASFGYGICVVCYAICEILLDLILYSTPVLYTV